MSHLFLYGPPGTGKSTIGRKLARNLKLPFVDLDRLIETKAGRSIAAIVERQGEAAFRTLETSALKETVRDSSDKIIALGGGALLREENRMLAESHGRIILLTAELSTLLEHMRYEGGKRPLLTGDTKSKLISLLEKRRDHYNSFPWKIQVDRKTLEQNVQEAQRDLGRYHLSAMGEYDVIVGSIVELADFLMQNPVILTDKHVANLHAESVLTCLRDAGYRPELIILPAGEEYKNLETIQKLWNGFLEHGMDRKSTVIALGGGVVGDLAGFAAATYMRGVNWICVPTTLLSMVDASLGGKTGFDLPQGKNLIGAFYPPKLVLADAHLLKTLPETELISGMAEVVKHGVIADPELFALCAKGLDCIKEYLEQIVKRAMAVKIQIIEDDPFEKGFRAALNLGHTVGHAVELVSKFELRHGEAIAIGMAVEAKFAERIGVARSGLSNEIISVLESLGLSVQIPEELPRQEILRAMRVDKKKNAARFRFALPAEIGKVELVDVADLESVLQEEK